MQHPFSVLAPEYAALLAAMRTDVGREHDLAARAAKVLELAHEYSDEWAVVESKTGVRRLWGIASFERESDSDYDRSPAQGDPWNRVSVNVPRGLGPYANWGAACIAAYDLDKLDTVGVHNWTWTRACYEGELFNGFGPRAHGRHTGYLWSWTNVYAGGKYVADGVWDPNTWDHQCGLVPMMLALLRLDASLALTDALPAPQPLLDYPTILPAPLPVGVDGRPMGGDSTKFVQIQINRSGADPQLVVDGSYGRATRRAVAAFQASHGLAPDGLAGPLTVAALAKAPVA